MYFCCCFLPLSIYTIPFLSKKVKKRDLHHFSRYVTCVTTLSLTPIFKAFFAFFKALFAVWPFGLLAFFKAYWPFLRPFGLLTFWPFGLLAYWPVGLLACWPVGLLACGNCNNYTFHQLLFFETSEHSELCSKV